MPEISAKDDLDDRRSQFTDQEEIPGSVDLWRI
jgi:hypothetical protein